MSFGQIDWSKKMLEKFNLVKIPAANCYMYKYEVSNLSYKEMMYYAAEKDSAIYKKMIPDKLVWRTPLSFNEKYVEYYFNHPAYGDYPVVGITYEQAILYCALLTEFFNTRILPANNEIAEVQIRLPNQLEWEEAARAGNPFAVFPWKHLGIRNPKTGEILANCRVGPMHNSGVAGRLNDGADVTSPSHSFMPNGYGLYNMAGNVAEMVSEKGISKGGSWIHGPGNLPIDSVFTYTKATSWLGFRYVMEVVRYRNAKPPTVFNVKDFEKEFVTVDSLKLAEGHERRESFIIKSFDPYLICKIETPNAWYKGFLNDMKQSNPSGVHAFIPNDSLWREVTSVQNYYAYSQQDCYDDYPVVNITQEAALAFCAWLTAKYNQDPARKYHKVIFKLPAASEWRRVTANYEMHPAYWFRYEKGKWKYKMNFHPSNELYFTSIAGDIGTMKSVYSYPDGNSKASFGLDGYELLAPVKSYVSDKLGLFNCFGNVAEMIENDKAKGGSWSSECHVDFDYFGDNENLTTPSPEVGFRMVMHILEK